MKHPHYKKPVAGLQFVDVYRVLALFGVTDPCLQHAVKKLLVAGGRGAKDIGQDVQEAVDTLQRWQEMRAEDATTMPADFGQQHKIEPASLIDDDSPRMQAIGQNGPSAEHYDEIDRLQAEIKPIGDCAACQTFAMACTGACAPLKEPQQPRHRCLACAGGHPTHEHPA